MQILPMLLLALVAHFAIAETAPLASKGDSHRAKWLASAKYGVFIHFLGEGKKWQERVDAFDVEACASEMEQAGAAYVFITLGQNSGYTCSPNSVYEKYAGYKPNERCSKRDLPMELAAALAKRKIRMLLYLPSRAPQRDPQAMQGLSDVDERQPAPQEFTCKWSDVIREWAERYGDTVSGWWFDGAYNTAGWDDPKQTCNWATWAAACRAGNPHSILAFNPGTKLPKAFQYLTGEQDYTAGEQNKLGATPLTNPAPEGVQWHLLTYLGSYWGKAKPGADTRFTDEEIIAAIRTINEQGGVMTLDVAHTNGRINPGHLRQLIVIRQALRPDFPCTLQAGKAQAPANWRVERDIAYLGTHRTEKADLYLPTNLPQATLCPAVIVIHGGGWGAGGKGDGRERGFCRTLVENGIAAFSIDYHLSPPKRAKEAWPQNIHDCKIAVRWLRQNAPRYGIDPDRIGVMGGSAGGHLASLIGVTGPDSGLEPAEPLGGVSCRVSAVVDLYGPILIGMGPVPVGDIPPDSPLKYLGKQSPPILLLHGTADKGVPIARSREFAAALKKAGVEYELIEVEGAKHGFGLQLKERDLRPVVTAFLVKHLRDKTVSR